jgi:hypothetical protein
MEKLSALSGRGISFAINDKETIEKDFGWIFFYNSKRFLASGDARYRLAGNGPIVVERQTGHVELFGSAVSVESILERYNC